MTVEKQKQVEDFRMFVAMHNYNPTKAKEENNLRELAHKKSQAFWTAWDLYYAKERLLQICKARSEAEIETALTSGRQELDTKYRTETISMVRDYIKKNGSRVPRKRQTDSV